MRSRILYGLIVAVVIAGMFRLSAPVAMQGVSLPARSYNAMAFMQEITPAKTSPNAVTNGGVSLTSPCITQASGAKALGCSPLFSPDANTVQQSNTTTAQSFLLYSTTDSNSTPVNYERLNITFFGSQFVIRAEKGGTGTSRSIVLQPGTASVVKVLSGAGSNLFQIAGDTGTINFYKGATALDATVTRGTLLASPGLVANSGPTTVLTGGAATAGLYNVCFQASTTTSGTGTTGTVTLAWNDGNAKSFTTGTWALNAVDVTGQVNSCQTIRVAASQNVTVATTIGAIGSSVYRVDASVIQLQ